MSARKDVFITQLLKQRARLKAALEFYADPGTYVAIMFVGDPPCGDFIRDFSDCPSDGLIPPGYRPGKRARKALRYNVRRSV